MDPGGLYEQWHAACREWRRDAPPPAGETDLIGRGFEKMTFLDPAVAEKIRIRIDAIAVVPENLIVTGEYQDKVHEPKEDFLFSVLEEVFSGEVERRIAHVFETEFIVHWYMYTRVHPHPAADESFLWHRDRGPDAFINIMVYLNGTGEHGGGTQLLDSDATEKIAQAGYAYPNVVDREGDLSEYAEKAGIPFEPTQPALEPGEGLIFRPTRVLHRGWLPTKGPRHVLFLNLMPSPCPWREGFQRWNKGCMEAIAGNWTSSHMALLAGEDGPTVIA